MKQEEEHCLPATEHDYQQVEDEEAGQQVEEG